MNLDTNIVTAIIGVFGVVIGTLMGSVLSGFGYWLRMRSEAKKVINQNIFNLFQLWHLVSIFEKSKFDDLVKLYISKVREHCYENVFPIDQDEVIQKQLTVVITQFLSSFLQKVNMPAKEDFYKGVFELSKYIPVMGYELSNNRYISDLLGHFDLFYNSIYKQNVSENPSNNEVKFFNDLYKGIMAAKEWTKKDFAKDLENDILKLARKGGINSWIGCKSVIRKRESKFQDKSISKFIDEYISEALNPLVQEQLENKG